MRSPCSQEGFERFAPFRVYRRGAPGVGHVSLCLRKPRRRETEREARGLPRTWTAYTRMRCGTTRNLAALRTAYRRAVELGPESVGSSRGDGSGALSDMATKASESGGGQRARPAFRIGDMRSLRPCRGRKGTFGRAQQGSIDLSEEGCASLFLLYAQRRELNHQPPILLGSLYSGKPPSSIPEPPLFLNMRNERQFEWSKGAVLI